MPADLTLTALLQAWEEGHPQASEELFVATMPELRRIARQKLLREHLAISLQATELVHEGYLRLGTRGRVHWRSREHFYAVAAMCFRRVLVDHAKRRGRLKRGGRTLRVALHEAATADRTARDSVDIERALSELARIRVSAARVVELRVFGGLSLDETAAFLGLSRKTVQRRWRFARAWLEGRLSPPRPS